MDVRLQRWVVKLKRDFPLSLPVRVRTHEVLVNSENHRLFGLVHKDEAGFHIQIQRHADVSVQIDTLWHEWTHCLIWPRCTVRHSKLFWETYGRLFAHYQDGK